MTTHDLANILLADPAMPIFIEKQDALAMPLPVIHQKSATARPFVILEPSFKANTPGVDYLKAQFEKLAP